MTIRPLPSPDTLRKLLDYDPGTGILMWRRRTPDMFRDGIYDAKRRCARWNSRHAGEPALNFVGVRGYRGGYLLNWAVKAHRVIWAIVHGVWPDQIDHINGDRSDNRLINLRDCTCADNMRNASAYSTNTSGTMGVHFDRTHGYWVARINVNKRRRVLGHFPTREEAARVRMAAMKQHGYHPNHGRTGK